MFNSRGEPAHQNQLLSAMRYKLGIHVEKPKNQVVTMNSQNVYERLLLWSRYRFRIWAAPHVAAKKLRRRTRFSAWQM